MGVVKEYFQYIVFWIAVILLFLLFLWISPSTESGYVGRFGDKYIEPDRAP